jgi:hypothetical protein
VNLALLGSYLFHHGEMQTQIGYLDLWGLQRLQLETPFLLKAKVFAEA